MTLALTNALVILCTGAAPIPGGTVVLDGERIAYAGPAAGAPPAARTVDCTGRTIMPGLVDAHVHFMYHEVSDNWSIEVTKPVEEAMLDATLNAALLLRRGVTSCREVGTRGMISIVLRDAIAAGRIPGPRTRASKQIISVWGGLGDFHPTHVFKREQYLPALTEIITGPWEARNAVRQHVKDGADWIKCEASGTGFNPLCPADRDTMSFEELKAIVDEATEKNRPVACHAESKGSIIKAARAGVRTIEHAVYLDDESLEAVLEAGCAICPTLGLYSAFAWEGADTGMPPAVVANHQATNARHVASIKQAHDAGVTIIAGSDAGLSAFPQPGVHREVCTYVERVGMSAHEALLTATRNASRVIGLGDEVGTLEAGKLADLLILRESPLERIRALAEEESVVAVLQGGKVVAGAL